MDFFRRRKFEHEMNQEMREHLERRTAEKISAGLPPKEARLAAHREFGGIAQAQEECRDARPFAWLEQLAQDTRYALRQLRRNPGFAAAAIAVLALGIGLNTAVFSVAYGVLWRPLPYPAADRLVMILSAQQTATGPRTFTTWAPVSYDALRTRTTSLDQLGAYSSIDALLTGRGEPRRLDALDVSPNFFATLGVEPTLGRSFTLPVAPSVSEATPSDERIAIVSDRLWRTSLSADPAIIGQTINIDGTPRTVIGVLPPNFSFRPAIGPGALPEVDIFFPNRWPADTGTDAFLFLLGRMKPGITQKQAEAELTALVNEPSVVPAGGMTMAGAFEADARKFARTVGLQEHGTESVRRLLLTLLGAVSFVLVIACVNVANLQMARLSSRRGELSVRMALGAGRRRIARQLLTEAVVLALLGASLGVAFAYAAINLILPLLPRAALPRIDGITIDARVLGFSLGLSVLATLVIGLLPTCRASARGLPLADGERLRTIMVAGQIAMTLVLLIGAGLMIHSFVRLTAVQPGFERRGPDGVVQVVRVTLPEHLYDRPERIHAFARGVLDRIEHLPAVKSASMVNSAPFGRMFIRDLFEIEGQAKPTIDAGRPKIEADYFKTMGIPLVAGREFTAQDTAEAARVAIITERIARDYFPGGPGAALGRRVRLDDNGPWLTIVGVAADVRQRGLDEEIQPMIYAPFQQERGFVLRFVSFVARTATPASVAEAIRAEIRRVAPDLPIEATVTMDEAVAASVAAPRFRTLLLGMFATTAMLIATCGIYGLMSYAVTQRRREIGVRMALGAQRADVMRLILGRALQIVSVGIIIGLLGAAGVTRVLQRFLFGVTATDPLVFLLVTAILITIALLAAYLPARRAAQVDPMTALRDV